MKGQTQVIIGILIAFVVIGLWLTFVPDLFTSPSDNAATIDRIGLSLRWVMLLQLPLIVGILTVSQQRFWSDEHADGSPPDIGSPMDVNRRYLTNTLEQTMLATIGLVALSVTVPLDYVNFVPALAFLFVLGRICFWVGYHVNPYTRAFGLALTFVPTIGVYIYVLLE